MNLKCISWILLPKTDEVYCDTFFYRNSNAIHNISLDDLLDLVYIIYSKLDIRILSKLKNRFFYRYFNPIFKMLIDIFFNLLIELVYITYCKLDILFSIIKVVLLKQIYFYRNFNSIFKVIKDFFNENRTYNSSLSTSVDVSNT